jgi:polo-like kinase 1
VDQYLNDDYMTKGYMPLRLPLSCLTMSPRFDPCLNNSAIVIGQPFAELNEMQGILKRQYFLLELLA